MLASGQDPHWKHDDEESFHEIKARAEACLQFLEQHPAQRICVVTHGAFLRILVGTMVFREHYSKPHFLDMFGGLLTSNTGVTYARNIIPERGWQVVSWNDSAHLG
jgi:broad specificity phosphatase PhoE